MNSLDEFTRNHWRGWFVGNIPMLDNKSPIEAAKTQRGRQQINELLAFYDSARSRGAAMGIDSIDINPPSKWVRWKLGMEEVPNGETVFEKEEKILLGNSTKAELELLFKGEAKGGKYICNVCCKDGAQSVCGNCQSRRYCSKECQVIDWKQGHKKFCRQQNARKVKKIKQKEIWKYLKNMCENPITKDLQPISFDFLMKKALEKGIITQDLIDAEREKNEEKFNTLLKSYGSNFEELITELYFEIQSDITVRRNDNPEVVRLKKEAEKKQKLFDGRLVPELYKQLEQKNTGVDITFSCFFLDPKTGMKNINIMALWQLYGTDITQITYSTMCNSHTKPSLFEFKKAIHCSIVAPTGIQSGAHLPHRPKYIRIANRWGEDYFNAIRFEILEAGIGIGLQTREEAEKECAEEGTDADGANLIFDP